MNKKFSKILLIFICLFVFMMLYGCKKEINDEAITSNKVLVERYSVSYYVDDELYWKKTYKVGAAIEQIEEPTKEGYTFKGWAEEEDEQDFANAHTGSYTFSDSKTMYAIFAVCCNNRARIFYLLSALLANRAYIILVWVFILIIIVV